MPYIFPYQSNLHVPSYRMQDKGLRSVRQVVVQVSAASRCSIPMRRLFNQLPKTWRGQQTLLELLRSGRVLQKEGLGGKGSSGHSSSPNPEPGAVQKGVTLPARRVAVPQHRAPNTASL